MSQSTTVAPRAEIGSGVLTMLSAAMRRLCAAYGAWRMEKAAIAALRLMSDRALDDIGLTRTEIALAVRGKAARTRAFVPVC